MHVVKCLTFLLHYSIANFQCTLKLSCKLNAYTDVSYHFLLCKYYRPCGLAFFCLFMKLILSENVNRVRNETYFQVYLLGDFGFIAFNVTL